MIRPLKNAASHATRPIGDAGSARAPGIFAGGSAASGFRAACVFSASIMLAAACVLSAGCGPKGQSGITAQSPERQSDAEYDVARDYFGRNEPRAALDHALKAVELNEENDKALYFTAAIYLSFCAGERGADDPDCKIDLAEKYAKAAVKANDTYRDARNLLGQIYINEKKFGEAIKVLEPLTRDPAYTQGYLAWGNLGWAQVNDGAVDDGIVSLKNSVAQQPQFCVGHYRLGFAYGEKKNDAVSAEKSYSDALAVSSDDCQALQVVWEARGRMRSRLARTDDSMKDLERCKSLSDKTAVGKMCNAELATLKAGGKI